MGDPEGPALLAASGWWDALPAFAELGERATPAAPLQRLRYRAARALRLIGGGNR
jgi:hypothetical protein